MRASDLIPIEGAAEFCGVSVNTIHSMRMQGVGPRAYRLGKRLMFDPADLETWIEARREPWGDEIADRIGQAGDAA
ncbi:MAG: helix-turn-helix domain-containing protein [Acidimicrobiales bacterium]